MANLNFSIQYPTPYYETQITNERITAGRRVHDRGIVYGPFLESGPGSGKGPTERPSYTRNPIRGRLNLGGFHGYHAFGRARTTVSAKARELVEHAIQRHIGRM